MNIGTHTGKAVRSRVVPSANVQIALIIGAALEIVTSVPAFELVSPHSYHSLANKKVGMCFMNAKAD